MRNRHVFCDDALLLAILQIAQKKFIPYHWFLLHLQQVRRPSMYPVKNPFLVRVLETASLVHNARLDFYQTTLFHVNHDGNKKTVYAAYIVTKKAAGPLDECRKKSKYRMPSVFSHTK